MKPKIRRRTVKIKKEKKQKRKGKYRYDIKNEDVKDRLDEGLSVTECSILFACSKKLINNIKKGIRRNVTRRKPLSHKICGCCGFRPVGRKLFFLCDYCYRTNECGAIEVHHCSYKLDD